jgi:hypothetical protein
MVGNLSPKGWSALADSDLVFGWKLVLPTGFIFSNFLFLILVSIICIEQTDTRLSTNDCALSSRMDFPPRAPYSLIKTQVFIRE